MKILHVAETVRGGVASYLNDLFRESYSRFPDYNITLLAPDSHISDIEVDKLSSYVNVVCFSKKTNRFLSGILMLVKCIKVASMIKPDVVHLHSTFAGLFLRIPLKVLFPKLNILYCSHGWAFDRTVIGKSKYLILLIEKFLAYFSDYIICISSHDYELAYTLGISKKKLILVQNGILDDGNINLEVNPVRWPENKTRVLFVGRFDHQKGVDIFFNALRQTPNAFAYVIGDSVLGDQKAYSSPENCSLLGWVSRDQIWSYYESADVLVISSRWEGFGLIAIEAMRSRLAVIASNVGGLKDIVINNITGYVVPPEDSESIAELITLTSRDEFKKLGNAGYIRFKKNFTMSHIVDKLDLIYKRSS